MNIIVNGRARELGADVIAYEYVVALADKTGAPSVTWRVTTDEGHTIGGCLAPGDTIAVREGMVFNVHHTGNA